MTRNFGALARHRQEMGEVLADTRDIVRRGQSQGDRLVEGDLRELHHEIELWDRDVEALVRDVGEDSPQVLAARAERIKLRLLTLRGKAN